MGLFTINKKEIENMVKQEFNETTNYLVAMKHNELKLDIFKFLVWSFGWLLDNGREYILYFNESGVYEKELSFSDKAPFLLIPWHEIKDFSILHKSDKSIITINHLDKKYSYKIHYNGRIMEGNRNRLDALVKENFKKMR